MKILARISELLETDLRDLFKHGRLVDERFLGEIESILVRAELPMPEVRRIVENVRRSHSHRLVQLDEIVAVVRSEFASIRH